MKNKKIGKWIAYSILLTLIISMFNCCVIAQTIDIYIPSYEFADTCGTWQKDSIYYSKWEPIDTIGFGDNQDTTWVYSKWKRKSRDFGSLVFCPCGCDWTDKEYRDRVSGVGIIQRKWKTTTYKYIPKPKNNFDRLVRKLKKSKK